jgi:hypothetical protein
MVLLLIAAQSTVSAWSLWPDPAMHVNEDGQEDEIPDPVINAAPEPTGTSAGCYPIRDDGSSVSIAERLPQDRLDTDR